MKKKVVTVLFIMFASQTFFSCCGECPENETFERNYTGLSVTAYDISGFSPQKITNKIYKNDFGLGVALLFEEMKVAQKPRRSFGLGFSSVQAIICECLGNTISLINADPIHKIKIYATKNGGEENIDVTESFGILRHSSEYVSLEEYFQESDDFHEDYFQVKLINSTQIPDSTVFLIKVLLQSGQAFTEETERIDFLT